MYQEFVNRNNEWMIATANNENINAVSRAKDFYYTTMQEMIKTLQDTTSFSELQTKHLTAKQKTLRFFCACRPKYGPRSTRAGFQAQLEKVVKKYKTKI